MVDEDVEPAVLLDHLADDASTVVRIADVALVNGRSRAAVLDRVAELLGAREIRREPSGDRRAPDVPVAPRWRPRMPRVPPMTSATQLAQRASVWRSS
jgi:hypothetical protein